MSVVDKQAVQQQVERLLASSHFKNSRRYPDLLRFVVERTLHGNADTLKERTLGIEVFGREPGFDTAGDSIVRVAAAEVRKRIAQYYQEDGHEDELRIDLPSGSYVARFRSPQSPAPISVGAPKGTKAAPNERISQFPHYSGVSSPWKKVTMAAATLLLIALATVAGIRFLGRSADQRDLLDPIWKSPRESILCIGTPQLAQNQPGANDQTAAALGEPTANNTLLPFADAMTLSRFEVLLNRHGKQDRVQLARSTTFSDLRSGPAILIGAFDNPWTLRLTGKMRFRFSGTDEMEGEIVDTRATPNKRWNVDFHIPYSDRTQDYAIVAIAHDETLDQPLLIAAGIGPNGTMTASEFLLNTSNLEALAKRAPANWSGKNVEVVLATQVIQGNSGPPQIVAAEFW